MASDDPSFWRLLRERPALRGFIAIRACDDLGSNMLNVAIGWYVYLATGTPMGLAYVGLSQFLPNLAVALVAGHVADRFDRRRVLAVALTVQAVCLAVFAVWAWVAPPTAGPVYVLLVIIGAARAFNAPSSAALLPRLVEAAEFPRAVAAASSVSQIFRIAGPAVGGIVYAVGGPAVFAVSMGLTALGAALAYFLPPGRPQSASATAATADRSVLGGIRFIRANRILLALISLDLFAVLLGGVSALMPIYARDILSVGPIGLGLLRCAPGAGAAVVGFALAHRSVGLGAGKLMLACVAGYGVSIVVFALSTHLWLSLAALLFAGGFDMVSMVIRQTWIQLTTPDEMRGRVSAVNFVFVGASFQLGEFESGVTAALFGTVPAAALGGLGTLGVVFLWSRIFPELRRTQRLAASTAAP
jgi:MFS family permease